MPRNWNPDELHVIIPFCTSIDGVLKALDIKVSGGNRETVKKWINDLGLDTSHFLGQGHRKGSTEAVVEKIPLEDILVENSSYTNSHRLKLRLISEGIKEHRCENCGRDLWLNQKIPLELHHLNGIRNDHRITNIELLCPNCHALTENYRALNIARVA